MKKINWDKNCYSIDGEPVFLASGEFHYFRVPKKDWRRRLELWKETGGNCVATYIPWILHEPVEGDFRFSDVPERDLEGFLTLCAEMGLFVIVRPGPYVYSEIVYAGLPPWLIENYPDLLLRAIDGRTFPEIGIVSYLHPLVPGKSEKVVRQNLSCDRQILRL
jgi:beta-galactosidase